MALRGSLVCTALMHAILSVNSLSLTAGPAAGHHITLRARCDTSAPSLTPSCDALVIPCQRNAVPMMTAPGPAFFMLDVLAGTLKLAWRLVIASVVAVALRPTVDSVLRSQTQVGFASLQEVVCRNLDTQILKKIFRPKLVAAEKAHAAKEARAAAEAKARAEEEAMAKAAAEAAEAAAVAEKVAEEAARVRKAEEAAKAKAAEEELLKREAEERERAAKVAEQQRLAREQIEKEKAEKAKADAERAAKAKAAAEKKAAEKAAAERAAADAAAMLAAVASASAAAEESVMELLGEITKCVEDDRIITFEDAGEAQSAALLASLTELEAHSEALSPDVVREGLIGFWKGRATSSQEMATNGLTGYGASEYKSVLAHFQCFSKVDEGSLLPTAQTVEVISDATTGNAASATLKGDFDVSAPAATGTKQDVLEDYSVLEFGGMKQFDAQPVPQRSTCAYLSPTLRVTRVSDGTIWVYEKVTAEEVTDEIFRLMSIVGPDDDEGSERDWSEAGYDS